MPDRVEEILEDHIRLTERQLNLLRAGEDLDMYKEVDLVELQGRLKDALARHRSRKANA